MPDRKGRKQDRRHAIHAPLPARIETLAQGANRAAAPRPAMIGEFQSWTAASHVEGGQKVCYAFTRARNMDGVP